MRFGKGNVTPGRILCLLLAIPVALSWASPLRAEGPPRPVGYYVDTALSGYPSLESMRERIRMKESAAIKAGALADPKLWMGIVNVPTQSWYFREEDMTGKEIGLSQMFPWPGMRGNAEEIVEGKGGGGIRPRRDAQHATPDVKMTYAELSSVRKQIEVVRRSQLSSRMSCRFPRRCTPSARGASPTSCAASWSSAGCGRCGSPGEQGEGPLGASQHAGGVARGPAGPPSRSSRDPFPYGQADLVGIYEAERPARKPYRPGSHRGDVLDPDGNSPASPSSRSPSPTCSGTPRRTGRSAPIWFPRW